MSRYIVRYIDRVGVAQSIIIEACTALAAADAVQSDRTYRAVTIKSVRAVA